MFWGSSEVLCSQLERSMSVVSGASHGEVCKNTRWYEGREKAQLTFTVLCRRTKVGENHKQLTKVLELTGYKANKSSFKKFNFLTLDSPGRIMSQRCQVYCPSVDRDICWLLMSELTDSAQKDKHRHCRSFNISLSVWAQGYLTSFVQRNQGGVDL